MKQWMRRLACVFGAVLALGVVNAPGRDTAQAQTSRDIIRGVTVEGNQRLEAATIASYLVVGAGDRFDPSAIDVSLKVLFATGLFADVAFERRGDVLVVRVVENPIVNRVIFEGNRALSDDRLRDEVQAQPRAIFTRARVQADVQSLIEIYRQSGRFAATITPKVVEQPQNRVDLIFEISEGPVTDVRRINFIGNRYFSDARLRGVVLTAESRFWKIFSTNDNYDPDRMEFDRELLRQFYTDRGYADFNVVSAVAELTPNQEDFFITFTVDEGEQYEFGEITVSTQLDKLDGDALRRVVPIKSGTIFQASRIEDSVDALTFAAGAAGYAFVEVRPRVQRDRDNQLINIEFELREGPRVYIERIDVVGNARTLDRVIRREMTLVEGDAFNRVLLNRSRNRIRALGYFGDVTVTEVAGSAPDRAVVQVEVQEQPTGELSFAAGFSSVDQFLFDLSITERNLRGRGQFLRLRYQASSRRQITDIRFTEPRFLGRNVAAGFELFNTTQDFSSEAGFESSSYGGSLRLGFPVTENASLGLRYTLRIDDIQVSGNTSLGLQSQDEQVLTSQVGYTLRWDRRNDPIRPTGGFDASISQDFAGFGGDTKFLRTQVNGETYRGLLPNVIATLGLSAGVVQPWGNEDLRISDRFFRGGSNFRGFDVAGIGPRVVTVEESAGADGCLAAEISAACEALANPEADNVRRVVQRGNAFGGEVFGIGTLEVAFPLGLPEEYGIRGSLFYEFGTLGVLGDEVFREFDSDNPNSIRDGRLDATIASAQANPNAVTPTSVTYNEVRDDLSFRSAYGFSLFWRSPIGPIRFDFSDPLEREDYDRTEVFRFSTTTRF